MNNGPEFHPVVLSSGKKWMLVLVALVGILAAIFAWRDYQNKQRIANEKPPEAAQVVLPAEPKVDPNQVGQKQDEKPSKLTMDQAIEMIQSSLEEIKKHPGYTARFIKQERIKGQLTGYKIMQMKLRHEPFSVYLKFEAPDHQKGEEVIYVEGENDGEMLAHGVGLQRFLGTQKLTPDGLVARMRGNKYPITASGMKKLLEKILSRKEDDDRFQRFEVSLTKDVEVNERNCQRLTFTQAERPSDDYIIASFSVYLDQETNLPIRYELSEWVEGKQEPVLQEEYTYADFNSDVELTDQDFDTKHPDYDFP